MDVGSLLERHVAAFNQGVRTGEFSAMVELFATDATMAFENIPVGPFAGREAIAAAYAGSPPTDEIVVLRTRETPDHVLAEFAWSQSPGQRGGDLEIFPGQEGIARLVVVYGGPPDRWTCA